MSDFFKPDSKMVYNQLDQQVPLTKLTPANWKHVSRPGRTGYGYSNFVETMCRARCQNCFLFASLDNPIYTNKLHMMDFCESCLTTKDSGVLFAPRATRDLL